MIVKHVLHEQGQTFLTGFENGDIVRALLTEDTDPSALVFADGLFIERLEEAVEIAEWLDREHAEGRTVVIDAYFDVAV